MELIFHFKKVSKTSWNLTLTDSSLVLNMKIVLNFLKLLAKIVLQVTNLIQPKPLELIKLKSLADFMLQNSSPFCLHVAALTTEILLSAAAAYQIKSST